MKQQLKNSIFFVTSGAKVLALSLTLALNSANAAFLVVQPSYDAADTQNANALKARAIAGGQKSTTRVEIVLQMTAATAALDLQTPGGLADRKLQVAAQVQQFQQANSAYFPNVFQSAELTPYIDAEITAAGIDAPMLNTAVISISEPAYMKESLLQTNQILNTALLPPVVGGSLGNTMIAIIDSGVANHPAFQQRIVGGGCSSSSLNSLPGLCATPTLGEPCAVNPAQVTPTITAALANCGHGTHVAGIAASSNVLAGTSGMLPSADF